jgi:type II secretory pathway pseudopilin PulG
MKSFLNRKAGYSLVDTMIAATILAIAVGAACSLTLGMNTEDEIAWRVSRGMTLLDNATALYGLGLSPDTISRVLPTDSLAAVSFGTEASETVSDLQLQAVDVSVTIRTVDDTGSWTPGAWTGGGDASEKARVVTARVYRSSFQLAPAP